MIEKYKKLLDSVAITLQESYSKNFNINLREEFGEMVKAIKKIQFIWRAWLVGLTLYCLAAFIVLIIRPIITNEESIIRVLYSTLYLIILMSPPVTALVLVIRKTNKLDKIISEAEQKLDAFEKVIDVLDPADLRAGTIRSRGVLTESGIRETLIILVKKLLFFQQSLQFASGCPYSTVREVEELCIIGDSLSLRLDVCISAANSVRISYQRLRVVRDVENQCKYGAK
jgi:hypothetical protein